MLSYKARLTTNIVVLHDSHTSPSQSDLENFLAVKGREMGLLDIGYHYLILRDGRLVECRPHNVQGTHLRSKHNRESIGVCLAGGRGMGCCNNPPDPYYGCCGNPIEVPEDNFTSAQWETLAGLTAYLARFYGPLKVVGHSELQPRHHCQCPPVNMEKVRACLSAPQPRKGEAS